MSDANLIESLDCSLILVNSDCVIERVNLACETLFCQSRRYLVGQNIFDLIPNKVLNNCLRQCIDSHAQFTLRELEVQISEREVLLDVTLSSMTIESGSLPSVLLELNEINRISHFMKEVNQLERQQAFRLMMRGLAHEIKNPLGGIRGAAQLLDGELVENEHRQLTDIMIKEADRLTRLVDRVMGSREQLKPVSLNIHEVLEHTAHIVSVDKRVPIHIERFYDPALPEITADKEQLIQAVLNIVNNGIEAQSGASLIKLGFATQFERFITINQVLHRQAMRIRIWDGGPGVSEDLVETLFDPLITGRPQGTGLGLSITQEIIQRHQGMVQLDDYHGNTCFSIRLPYIEESGTALEPKVEQL